MLYHQTGTFLICQMKGDQAFPSALFRLSTEFTVHARMHTVGCLLRLSAPLQLHARVCLGSSAYSSSGGPHRGSTHHYGLSESADLGAIAAITVEVDRTAGQGSTDSSSAATCGDSNGSSITTTTAVLLDCVVLTAPGRTALARFPCSQWLSSGGAGGSPGVEGAPSGRVLAASLSDAELLLAAPFARSWPPPPPARSPAHVDPRPMADSAPDRQRSTAPPRAAAVPETVGEGRGGTASRGGAGSASASCQTVCHSTSQTCSALRVHSAVPLPADDVVDEDGEPGKKRQRLSSAGDSPILTGTVCALHTHACSSTREAPDPRASDTRCAIRRHTLLSGTNFCSRG